MIEQHTAPATKGADIGKARRNMEKIRKIKKGTVIFRAGDIERCMYEMLWGTVDIYANYGKPDEKLLTRLSVAEDVMYFGEMGMLESMPRSATAVAVEETLIRVITDETFGEVLEEKPGKVMDIMQHMSERIRELTRNYMDACRAVAQAEEAAERNDQSGQWQDSSVDKFVDEYRLGTWIHL